MPRHSSPRPTRLMTPLCDPFPSDDPHGPLPEEALVSHLIRHAMTGCSRPLTGHSTNRHRSPLLSPSTPGLVIFAFLTRQGTICCISPAIISAVTFIYPLPPFFFFPFVLFYFGGVADGVGYLFELDTSCDSVLRLHRFFCLFHSLGIIRNDVQYFFSSMVSP